MTMDVTQMPVGMEHTAAAVSWIAFGAIALIVALLMLRLK